MAYRITLEFESGETLRDALEYIGDSDAPVMPITGTVEYDGTVGTLWQDWNTAMEELAEKEERSGADT